MSNEEKSKSSAFKTMILILLCIGAVVGAWLYIDWAMNRPHGYERNEFAPQYHVSLEQILRLSDALEAYTKKNGKRPVSLDDLVTTKFITRKALFDPARNSIPTKGPYDVVYNPAVLPSDPKDCVVLHTIFLSRQDESFYAVHNDYTISQFNPRELVKALNDTYRIIGEDIAKKQQTSKTVPIQLLK